MKKLILFASFVLSHTAFAGYGDVKTFVCKGHKMVTVYKQGLAEIGDKQYLSKLGPSPDIERFGYVVYLLDPATQQAVEPLAYCFETTEI